VDALEVGDELVVLLGRRAVRVTGLAATVWLLLSGPHTFDELVRGAEARLGEHPDARALVEEAIEALVEENLAGYGTLA
jgi:hypothetical protein